LKKGFDRERWMRTGRAAAAGWFIIFATGLPTALGYWLDGRWDTRPWGMVVGLCIGVAASARELYVIAKTTRLGGETGSPPSPGPGEPSP
jgi:F0F1-type ATP synthase assembly protein I